MQEVKDKPSVGVIIGRFQVPELTKSHMALIDHVRRECSRTIIILGISPLRSTPNNPLDYEQRVQMIDVMYTNYPVTIAHVADCQDDVEWSHRIDQVIHDLIGCDATVALFGGRDSFIKHYTGIYKTIEMRSDDQGESGTDIREDARKESLDNNYFRRGVIWGVNNQYNRVNPTVDVAILTPGGKILLGRKPGEDKWRFIGGFASGPTSYERDAKREVMEETGLEVGDLTYVGSYPVDDWRVRSEKKCSIMTTLFTATYVFGHAACPADDIEELEWFTFDKCTLNSLIPAHRDMFLDLLLKEK